MKLKKSAEKWSIQEEMHSIKEKYFAGHDIWWVRHE